MFSVLFKWYILLVYSHFNKKERKKKEKEGGKAGGKEKKETNQPTHLPKGKGQPEGPTWEMDLLGLSTQQRGCWGRGDNRN